VDKKTKEKLARLEKIDQSNRDRARKYLAKAKEQGKKQVSALISSEAYDIICKVRDRAALAGVRVNLSYIIDQAILASEKTNVKSNVKANAQKNKKSNVSTNAKIKPSPECQTLIATIDPDNFTIADRHRLVLKLSEVYPGKKNAQVRVDILNNAGIKYNGNPWKSKNFSDQKSKAKKWAEAEAKGEKQ